MMITLQPNYTPADGRGVAAYVWYGPDSRSVSPISHPSRIAGREKRMNITDNTTMSGGCEQQRCCSHLWQGARNERDT